MKQRSANKTSIDDICGDYQFDSASLLSECDRPKVIQTVSNILELQTVVTIKTNVQKFLQLLENADDINSWAIQSCFWEEIVKRDKMHQSKTSGLPYNAVIIPPEYALAATIPAFVRFNANYFEFVAGLNRFIARCDEFVTPIYPAITEPESHAVLSAVQRAFKMIDIIVPDTPIRLHRFDYSHIQYNSQCGLADGDLRQSVLFLYHPRENDIYDRVFIFAHELGHALHFALTGDVNVIPKGYDKFNEMLGVKLETAKAKQEGFADAVAYAILGSQNSRIKSHLPAEFCKAVAPVFVRYIQALCGENPS